MLLMTNMFYLMTLDIVKIFLYTSKGLKSVYYRNLGVYL